MDKLTEIYKWVGEIKGKVQGLCSDIAELKASFGNHLTEHKRYNEAKIKKSYRLAYCLLAGVFILIGYIVNLLIKLS